MTLRDYFAGQALMGEMMPGTEGIIWKSTEEDALKCAKRCLLFADAMLAESLKEKE